MSKKNSLLAMGLGSIGGMLVAMLFAKHKGEDVRKRLADKKATGEGAGLVMLEELGGMKEEIMKASKDFFGSKEVKEIMDNGKKKIHDFYDDAKGKGEDMMKEAQKQLLEYSKVAQDKAAALGEEMKRRGTMAWSEIREDTEDAKNKAEDKARDVKRDVTSKVDEVKARFGGAKK